ncbi:uncharacterized protein AB675_2667 [Cyphellophora attinorum]|uniref:Uncharacterized protein n=1 Tax=Cyphellophora attinorum TaxID=1664694 RepID=A0A0N1HH85_9EURO|nr:uncharacterized protein AB675_2667 [Phialophora attinorum]KPI45295.1 hypothetical protein AB675_2667 [Phialophora attinorum]
MIVLLFLYLTLRAFAQIPPGDHTIGTANPTFSVLDCSARDVLTSQLASCLVSQDAAKPNYPEDCQTLVWIQGLLTTCTSGPAATATAAADREEVEEDFMGEAESETTLSTSSAAPKLPLRSYLLSISSQLQLLRTSQPPLPIASILTSRLVSLRFLAILYQLVLVYIDTCEIHFWWRGLPWAADFGICGMCKWLEGHQFAGLPYNIFPDMLKKEICAKWQPPNDYDGCFSGWRKNGDPFQPPPTPATVPVFKNFQ